MQTLFDGGKSVYEATEAIDTQGSHEINTRVHSA